MGMDPIELSRKIRGALAPCSLGGWPTPADVRPDLAAATGCAELWLKREDRSSTRGGGNKVRGLEFLLIGLPAGAGCVTIGGARPPALPRPPPPPPGPPPPPPPPPLS